MYAFFPPPSEDQQKQMKDAYEKHRMYREEFQHSFQRLIEELDEDQLKTLRTAFCLIMDAPNSTYATEWQALFAWEMRKRFNVCVTCGVNHDKELQEKQREIIGDLYFDIATTEEAEILPIFRDLTPEDRELANQYHLDDLREEGTNELLGFICTGINGMNRPCGMRYPSIQDRMLHEPEHCSGCFIAMGQG